ncbi:hypothetical protein ACTIVE_5687 [Actinomadura verrucosospora]|uniref:Uncharacterized protein n=2 Tax=Actinomadura verrucosospora TaxID=46165 RepID=A0A7D4A2U9_ACTVE|nr:hypothetical protein ACTIVE_5687 [Actinomadura verrucosospora]
MISEHGPAWTYIDYHQFFLTEPEQLDFVAEEVGDLISATGESVIVHTGIANGHVAVHVQVHDDEPPLDEAGWEEIAEAAVQVENGPLMVRCLMEDAPDLPALTSGPGDYRVRAHARGRGIAYDACVHRSQEVYLFQVWPAPYLPLHVLEHTDHEQQRPAPQPCGAACARPARGRLFRARPT